MKYKKDFPIFRNKNKLIYLDSAATSQKPQSVVDAVNNFYTKYNSNIARGFYDLSKKAEELYEGSRNKVSKFINAQNPKEIIFTGNTTESINLAAFGYFKKSLKKDDIVVLSEMEHHSNIVPWQELQKTNEIKIYYLPITNDYLLDYKNLLKEKINFKKVKLISLTQASNVLGTVNPLDEIISILKTKCPNAKILVDAAQSAPHIRIDVKKLDCDFLTFSSHKMFGPAGVGVLFAREEILKDMDPLFYGGHMISSVSKERSKFLEAPEKFEAGTGKLELAYGLGAAIDYINTVRIKNVQKYEQNLTKYGLSRLQKIQNVQVYGPKTSTNRLPVFSFNIANVHPHDVSEILNRKQICVRTGHHCAEILSQKLNLPFGSVRASLSIYNTKDDIDELVKGIEEVKKIFKIK
jgi:cysteine desulfurase / selenocysteine lyase